MHDQGAQSGENAPPAHAPREATPPAEVLHRQTLPNRFAPACKRIIHDWRRLTQGNSPTIVACSGGADSSALALALAAAGAPITLITIRHHQRPAQATDADLAAVQALAQRLNAPFAAFDLPRATRATESAMRKARYALLAQAALERSISFVATAHHADDQLESILLALLRGSGLQGLRGIAPKRTIPNTTIQLIRPMLGITRARAQAICAEANWQWNHDSTNDDRRYRRAALRARVLPILEELKPGASLRASHTAQLLRDAAAIVDQHIQSIITQAESTPRGPRWQRRTLAAHRPSVITGVLRAAADAHALGKGRDALTHNALAPIARAIRDASTEPRAFQLRNATTVRVTAREVALIFDSGT